MSTKKYSTPVMKASNSASKKKSNTAKSINSTLSNSKKKQLDTTLLPSCSRNVDGICNSTAIHPTYKPNLTFIHAPQIDSEMEMEFAYNEYLQAVAQHQFCKQIIENNRKVLNNQLSFQECNLNKTKATISNLENDLKKLKLLENVDDIISILSKNLQIMENNFNDNNTGYIARDILIALQSKSKKVALDNIKLITTPEDYQKLTLSLKKCVETTERIIKSEPNIDDLEKLEKLIGKINITKKEVEEEHQATEDLQNEISYDILKNISNIFAND